MLSQKNFEILQGVMAFLVLLNVAKKVVEMFNFDQTFCPSFGAFTKCDDAFCWYIFPTSGQEWMQNILEGRCDFELG